MAKVAAWRLSEKQQERIRKEFKIPVDCCAPSTYWIVSLSDESIMPTKQELRQIRSYSEFIVQKFYNKDYQHRILVEKELPACGGHNTMILQKGSRWSGRSVPGWRYRKLTWNIGPLFVPDIADKNCPHYTLLELIERIERFRPEVWIKWQKDHPEIFPQHRASNRR